MYTDQNPRRGFRGAIRKLRIDLAAIKVAAALPSRLANSTDEVIRFEMASHVAHLRPDVDAVFDESEVLFGSPEAARIIAQTRTRGCLA